ncbi:MAG: DUF4493 domain-containing protein [Mucinivorans sp.]
MKKIFLLLAVSALFVACNDGKLPSASTETGVVTIGLKPGAAIIVSNDQKSTAPASKADQTVDVNTFAVNINTATGEAVKSYAAYSDVPGALELPLGAYKVMARNDGVTLGGEWDKPLYQGESPFVIAAGSQTTASVECALKSTGIKVIYSPETLNALTGIATTLSLSGVVLIDTPNEPRTRTAWFAIPEGAPDASIVVHIKGTGKDGKPVEFENKITKANAKELRNLTVKVLTAGNATLNITVDQTITTKDVTVTAPDVIENGGDTGSWEEGGTPPTPPTPAELPKIKMADGTAVPALITINRADVKKPGFALNINITSVATGGIKELGVIINSAPLVTILAGIDIAAGQEIDLANPPAVVNGVPGWVGLFSDPSIGLVPAEPIKGKSQHTFAIGGLMGMLVDLDQTDANPAHIHTFTLRVKDANVKNASDQTTCTAVIKVKFTGTSTSTK